MAEVATYYEMMMIVEENLCFTQKSGERFDMLRQ